LVLFFLFPLGVRKVIFERPNSYYIVDREAVEINDVAIEM